MNGFIPKTFKRNFSKFAKANSGAVTTDWIVMTTAIAGFGIIAGNAVFGGSNNVAEASSTSLVETVEALNNENG